MNKQIFSLYASVVIVVMLGGVYLWYVNSFPTGVDSDDDTLVESIDLPEPEIIPETDKQQKTESKSNNGNLDQIGSCTLEEAGITKVQMGQLLSAYEESYTKHIRIALDNYLSGSDVGLGGLAKTGIDNDGLDAYDKSYYKSRFMVYWIESALGGGKEIVIIPLDKPDKFFRVWVYKLGSGNYELRAFSDIGVTQTEISELMADFDCFLEDDRFEF